MRDFFSFLAKLFTKLAKRKIVDCRFETVKCIVCLKPAKVWTGHVRKDKVRVIAGWCRRCSKKRPDGFFGQFNKKYGLIKTYYQDE